MAKFVIKCPDCESCVEGRKGFLGIGSSRTLTCGNGHVFKVKPNRMLAVECDTCKNVVGIDQTKGRDVLCPICKNKLNSVEAMRSKTEITCPQCSCTMTVGKDDLYAECPVCGESNIDVVQRIELKKIKEKGVISVIKYEGDNNTLVFKHPVEDFNLGSQLIVHESQEAIFFKDGRALDLFGSGRYTLSTQNIPLLEELYKLPTNSSEIFHSEVYFINMTTRMGVKWGTSDKIRMFEPSSGLHIELGACGQFNLRVTDSRKLLLKLVGTGSELEVESFHGEGEGSNEGGTGYSTDSVIVRFKTMLNTKFKSIFPRVLRERNINVLIIDEYLDEISAEVKKAVNADFEEYGLTMPEFYISNVMFPEDPNFRKYKQQFGAQFIAEREAQIRKGIIEANMEADIAEREARAKVGYAEAEGQIKIDLMRQEAAAKMELIKAQTEAEKMRATGLADVEVRTAEARNIGLAEAEAMRAKGYTEKDVLAAGVQQTMAESIGKIGENGGGGGGVLGGVGGSITSEMLNIGLGIGTAGAVIPQVANMFNSTVSQMTAGAATLASNTAAAAAPAGGAPASQPAADTWDCACGNKGVTLPFCGMCGAKKPAPAETWDCTCGHKGNTLPFCGMCGAKKPETPESWDCPDCGFKGITTKFCPSCGKKKED